MEKQYGNMKISNKRNYNEFKIRTRIFLKENFYFIVQNYLINFIVNESQNYFINFISMFFYELDIIIQNLLDINNYNQNCILIRQHIEICYKKKLASFSKNNIFIKSGTFIKEELSNPFPHIIQPYIQNKISEDEALISFEKNDSLIFKNNKINNFIGSIQNREIKNNLVIEQENDWKLLNKDLNKKIYNFMKEIIYQDSSIIFDNEDETFNLL